MPIPKTFLFLLMKAVWLHFIYLPRVKATMLTTSVRVHRARNVRQFLGAGRNFLALSLTYFTLRDFYQIYAWHNRKKKHVFFDQDPTFFLFKCNVSTLKHSTRGKKGTCMACRQLQDHIYKKAAGGVESQIMFFCFCFFNYHYYA